MTFSNLFPLGYGKKAFVQKFMFRESLLGEQNPTQESVSNLKILRYVKKSHFTRESKVKSEIK